MCDKYMGYTNYNTWVTMLWLENEEGSYNFWRDMAAAYIGQQYDFADFLKEYHETEDPRVAALLENASVYSDLFGHALQSVNWHEIADHLLDDLEEE